MSRFAKNTLNTFRYIRELKEHNVSVRFEEKHIDTLTIQGKLMLTVLSPGARQEVNNTSEYVKRGLNMKMARGELVY